MTFDGITVRHATLDRASSDLTMAAQRIRGRLEALDGELAPLATQWSGEAQRSYRQAQGEWDRAMAEMVDLLRQVGAAVAQSNEAYRAADRRGAARFG